MEEIFCPNCKTEYRLMPDKCLKCNYPFSGTKQEQGKFIAAAIIMKDKLNNTKKVVNIFRYGFFIVGILLLIGALFGGKGTIVWYQFVATGIVSFIAGILSLKKPFTGILFALIGSIFIFILAGIIDSSTILRSIISKILVMGGMIYCLNNLIELGKYQNKKPNDIM